MPDQPHITPLVTKAQEMAKRLSPWLSAPALEAIQQRVQGWHTTINESVKQAPIEVSPLVKKSRGLPQPIDEYYFTLVKDPYAL